MGIVVVGVPHKGELIHKIQVMKKTAFILLINLLLINCVMAKTFELFKLPYAADALEPAIGKETVEYHYGKHVQTYVNNLNGLIPGTEFENMELEEIVAKSDGAVFNNAAQIWNHQFYFYTFCPPSTGGAPTGDLARAIDAAFGSFDNFKKEFAAASASIFGSGWSWLVKDNAGKLSILKEGNAGNPVKAGLTALLAIDVWEHAYYIDYRNRRADHINAIWDIIDWKVVEKRYAQ